MRAGRPLVPIQSFEVVAHELFVEARRAFTHPIGIDGPESGRVWRQCLVDEREMSGLVQPELELRIRDDDPARERMLRRERIERERGRSYLLRDAAPDECNDALVVDVFVVLADL